MADMRGATDAEPPPSASRCDFLLKRFGLPSNETMPLTSEPGQILDEKVLDEPQKTVDSHDECGLNSRKVVTGLPRSQTFKRRLSEQRSHLEPVFPTADERRATSVDMRCAELTQGPTSSPCPDPRSSAPGLIGTSVDGYGSDYTPKLQSDHGNYELSNHIMDHGPFDSTSLHEDLPPTGAYSTTDAVSVTASQHEDIIADELARKWILNLSMHFRDRSKREKFFVTYREKDCLWRRVTISLDYRGAPANSLEMDLQDTHLQREKSAKIYEAIRESLPDIQFYETVTNLKLQTTGGRLHVHVVEDGNEIIHFPTVDQVRHIKCRRIRERDIVFDSHLSGFVYKVHVRGQTLIKKEIPSPDTVEEFLYEVNALGNLGYSRDIVRLHGVVVDDYDEQVKGLLISYAEQGALIDVIYENCKEQGIGIPWTTRQRWARQIVRGLADIHESGFVQGDLTLTNIVVDAAGDAKIIDINRRGCPVGWEPPEMTALIEAHHRITMYIGVKSDLYQLGMVLWALAMLEDEPETHGRPLMLGPEINIPDWYRHMTEICLSADPKMRLAASSLLHMFPPEKESPMEPTASADDTRSLDEYSVDYPCNTHPYVKMVEGSNGWQYSSKTYVDTSPDMYEPPYPPRGRSPPRPLPSDLDGYDAPSRVYSSTSWAANKSVRPSYSDMGEEDAPDRKLAGIGLRPETPLSLGKYDVDSAAYLPTDIRLEDISPKRATATAISRKLSLGDGLQMLSTPKLSRQDTAIHAPVMDDSPPETKPSAGTTETAEQSVDELQIVTDTVADAVQVQAVSDTHETKATESDIDGGVSLELESGTSAHSLHLQSGLRSDAHQAAQPEDKTSSQTVAMHGNDIDMVKPISNSGAETAGGEIAPGKPDTYFEFNQSKEFRLGDFLKNSGKPEIVVRPPLYSRPVSLPLALAGIGAGLPFDNDTITMRDKGSIDDEFNALARPATVQALMVTTDSHI